MQSWLVAMYSPSRASPSTLLVSSVGFVTPMENQQTSTFTPGWNDPPPNVIPTTGIHRLQRHKRLVDPSITVSSFVFFEFQSIHFRVMEMPAIIIRHISSKVNRNSISSNRPIRNSISKRSNLSQSLISL